MPMLAKDDIVVAFGDSITFGTGAEPQESYPAVLEQMIGRRVINAGVPGEITAEGLSRLPQILESEKPALLILCHGGNDHLRQLKRGQAADNIREMIPSGQAERHCGCFDCGARFQPFCFSGTYVQGHCQRI